MVRCQDGQNDCDSDFQYSLCRVVLMVGWKVQEWCSIADFQYSLCRVVLMVLVLLSVDEFQADLSVLALSSRFDGRSG